MDSLGYASYETPWTVKFRSFLASFSDVFSNFGTHIGESYNHDRCYRSVQMRLYTLSKRQFVLVFAGFFMCFAVSVFIGVAGPPIVTEHDVNASALQSPKVENLATGPFQLRTPTLSTFNQQLWLTSKIFIRNPKGDTIKSKFTMSVVVEGQVADSSVLITGERTHNHSRTLHCNKETCNDLVILHLGYLDFTTYLVRVMFFGISDKYPVTEVGFSFKMYNPTFTQLEIWFRFVFLVLTFMVTCVFAHSLRRFSIRDWSIEQKWMSILLPLLLLYNDPIFPLTFLVNSWVPGMFDAVFQASFLCALLLFWLCAYHGIRQYERRFMTFYVPKVLIVGLLWISAVTLASWQEYNELQDPTYQYKVDTVNFTGMQIFFFVIGSVYLLYLLYLIIRAFSELRAMPYFDLRLKFLTALMFVVLAISIAITVMRFGTGVLQDNFVADLATHYKNSAEFLSFYGLLNFYLYTMAYVYSPSKNALHESHFKDNPAFSMLNDSEDEVIYGSDNERNEERTRLTKPVPAYQDSDSD
ncbi:transmembrane protein 181-like isoform X1 [Branchiostoma floridae x Branchiostoma japonicum]